MSWSVAIPPTTITGLGDVVANVEPPYELPDEAKEQLDAAKAVALLLAQSGALGSEETVVQGALSGHSNPEHDPLQGSPESINVSLYQAPQSAEAA